jgi:hypothetical protein
MNLQLVSTFEDLMDKHITLRIIFVDGLMK